MEFKEFKEVYFQQTPYELLYYNCKIKQINYKHYKKKLYKQGITIYGSYYFSDKYLFKNLLKVIVLLVRNL